jgi:hypothetical protein
MRAAATASILLAACIVAGCGNGEADFSSPEATFRTLWRAAEAGDHGTLLACFSKSTRERLEAIQRTAAQWQKRAPKKGKSGTDIVAEIIAESRTIAPPLFGEQTIEGDRASLEVTFERQMKDGAKRKRQTVEFVREAEGWKVRLALPNPDQLEEALPRTRDET